MNYDKEANNHPAQSQSQWIFSLAISVILCAVLFVILAFFITEQRIGVSTTALRLDILQSRQDMLVRDVDSLRQVVLPVRTPTVAATVPTTTEASGVVVDKAPEPAVDEKAVKN